MNIKIYFILFLIYAIMGWIMEVALGCIKNKKFVNRGFLIGPYCPIYGAGAIIITTFLKQYRDYPFALFCMAIVLCGLLEYLTSFVMEKIFKARWWDYSDRKYNINGRVCLETIIPFGLLSCMIIYLTNPFFITILQRIPPEILKIIFIVCLSIFVVDCIVSLIVIYGLRATVNYIHSSRTSDNTEEITKKVKEILTSKSFLDRRLINAFPKISIDDVRQKIKETTEHVIENVSKVKEEATQYIKDSSSKIKETTIKAKDDATKYIKENTSKVTGHIKDTAIKAKEKASEHKKGKSN